MNDETDRQVELAVEETTLERLESLGRGQHEIFVSVQRERRRWAFLAFGVIAAIAILGLGNLQTGQRLNDIVQVRNDSRAATCASDNRFIDRHNHLVHDTEEVLRQAQGEVDMNASIAAEQRAQIDAFYAQQIARFETEDIVQPRDCSPDGIARFYTSTTAAGG